jgi:transposase-like protein
LVSLNKSFNFTLPLIMTTSLSNIYKSFPTQGSCIDFLELSLWENRPICPYCKSNNFTKLKEEKRYHCNTCNSSFSVTVHTIFHRTKCDLQKWFLSILLISKSDKKIPARNLAEQIGVTKDTAWRISQQIDKNKAFIEFISERIIKSL